MLIYREPQGANQRTALTPVCQSHGTGRQVSDPHGDFDSIQNSINAT
jgi:hypothetical protein